MSSEEAYYLLKKHQCFVGIPFAKGMISELYDKFLRMQHILEEHKEDANFTHLDLLYQLEKALANRYKVGFATPMSVDERFNKIDGPLYERKKNVLISSTTAQALLQSQNVPIEDSVIDAIREGRAIGPQQGLRELEDIRERLSVRELGTTLAEFKKLPRDAEKELFLKRFDFAKTDLTNQRALLEEAKKVRWRRLFLRNCDFLTKPDLENLDLSCLTKLDISGCAHVTEDIFPLLAECGGLEHLNVSSNINIARMGARQLLSRGRITFASLAHLKMNQCAELTGIYLDAPQLLSLEAQQCPKLADLDVQSPTLKNLDVRSNPALTDTGLEKLNCPSLRTLYLQDSPQISFPDVRQIDPLFPVKLLTRSPEHFRELIKLLLQEDRDFTSIHLGMNRTNDTELQALCSVLSIRHVVTSLHLGINPITDEGIKALAEMLKKNVSITHLDLGDTNASSNGMLPAFQALQVNTTLAEIKWSSREEQVKEEAEKLKNPKFLESLPKFD